MSRSLIWTALFLSAGFLLLLLLVAASGALNAGWYYLGAAVYTIIILMLLVAVLLRRDESTTVVLETVAEEDSVQERVLYTTAHGEVTERIRTGPAGSQSDFKISNRGAKKTLDEIERRVDRSGWAEADLPSDRNFREALRRYGRIREVS